MTSASAGRAIPDVLPAGHDDAYLNTCFVAAAGRPSIATEEIARDEILAELVARYSATFRDADIRAVGSMWWQYYVSLLVPPALALCAQGRQIDVAPGALRAIVDDLGLVRAFVAVPAATGRLPETWFCDLLTTHCEPVVDALKAVTGVSRKVLWGNAAARLHALCACLDAAPPVPALADRLRAFTSAARLADGRRNPLDKSFRRERPVACCLRYRLKGFERCAFCPK